MENNNKQNFNPQQPPINPTPLAPAKKLSNKTIAIIILAAIASIVSWIALTRQPKTDLSPIIVNHRTETPTTTAPSSEPNDLKDWKTYTNDDYGFTFSYPSSWALALPDYSNPPYIFSLNTDNPPGGPSLDLKVRLTKEGNTKPDANSLFVHSSDQSPTTNTVYCSQTWKLVKNNALFEFSSNYNSDSDKCYITYDISNKIISSFKFTAPDAPYGVRTWDTYTNSQYGFNFKYPKYIKVGDVAPNSVLGTADNPIPGFFVGPYVFVIATGSSQTVANNYIKSLPKDNDCRKVDGPCASCTFTSLNNLAGANSVECGGEGGSAYYAFIPHNDFAIFVDGYSGGWIDSDTVKKEGSLQDEDMDFILSTFKFTK